MFGSNVIDILIGLIVVFLSVSLSVSAGTEMASHWFSMRPKQLAKALVGMIDGGKPSDSKNGDAHWFFDQTLIASMRDVGKKFPSYMDPKTFSEALLFALDEDFANKKGAELVASVEQKLDTLSIDDGVKALIRNYIRRAEGDAAVFRRLVEGWFDRVMDRASGWYKRNVSTISLVIAAAIVGVANVDALAITRALYGSDTLRGKMIEKAQQLARPVQNPAASTSTASPSAAAAAAASKPPATEAAATTIAASTPQSPAPKASSPDTKSPEAAPKAATAGQSPASTPTAPANPTPAPAEELKTYISKLETMNDELRKMPGLPLGWEAVNFYDGFAWMTRIVGWLITICAASLGAPFWFDMLSKIINIRSAGPKPLTKTEVDPARPGTRVSRLVR